MLDTNITLEKRNGAYWLNVDNPSDDELSDFTLAVGGVKVPFVRGAAEAPCIAIKPRSSQTCRTGILAVDEARLPAGAAVSWIQAGATYRRQLERPS